MMTIHLTEKQQQAKNMLCLPLDGISTALQVEEMVTKFKDVVGVFKIGKELFTYLGPEAIKIVHSHGAKVFLDLKFHDIPNTVKGAAKAATLQGVYMFNVHACGGLEMMRAAVTGMDEAISEMPEETVKPKIIGVTVLTSQNEFVVNKEVGYFGSVRGNVMRFASLVAQTRLDGIVSSAKDLSPDLTNDLPSYFMYVTPGVALRNGKVGDDQKRVVTPCEAVAAGSSLIVAGRTIMAHDTTDECIKAALAVINDISEALC